MEIDKDSSSLLVQSLLRQESAGSDVSIKEAIAEYVDSNVEMLVRKCLDFIVSVDHPYYRRQQQINDLLTDGATDLAEQRGRLTDKKYEVDKLVELIKQDVGLRLEDWTLRYGVDKVEPSGKAFWSGKAKPLDEI